ncbi:MAG: D-alanyl-D-alanine carboxypeptidase family protein [Parachlamydiaceae bacterium]|nr:D-alanyl-D-alanine carboxypeptidase family protein [Parachlamydiaceae bacterium]
MELLRKALIVKKNYFKIVFFLIGFSASLFASEESFSFKLKGESALLINGDTGVVLFEKNAHNSYFPASTTKIATALYALKIKKNSLSQEIIAEQDSIGTLSSETKRKMGYKGAVAYRLEPDGTHIGIKKGEILTFEDLLKGMMIASANDAANVIAHELGPTVPTFMNGMNQYLQELGCKKTFFTNPHGLHDPGHQTTAHDLAIIAKEALKNPLICEIISQPKFVRPKTNKQLEAVYLQGNRLLRPGKFYYSKAIGIKTGYHSKAKHTFVGAAKDQERTLILVLLGYQDRSAMFQEAIELFNLAFNQEKIRNIYIKEGTQSFSRVITKSSQELKTYLKEPLDLVYYPSEDPKAKPFLYWYSVELPILKDQPVGEVRLISSDQKLLKTVSLHAVEDVNLAFTHQLLANWGWGLAILGLILGGFLFFRRAN